MTAHPTRNESPCVAVVACCHAMSAGQMREALDGLSQHLRTHLFGVVVDNQARDLPKQDARWMFIRGSNLDFDFSAYNEGLQSLQASGRISFSQPVLFLNDSLFSQRGAKANLSETLRYADVMRSLQVPALCGRIDRYTTLCHANPWSRLPLYVPSYCFLLNSLALPILNNLSRWADEDGVVASRSIADPQWGLGLQPNMREFIRAFLSYAHPDFAWPGLRRYAHGEVLRSTKARCIYFEHRLSGELGRVGCLIPTNVRRLPRWRLYWAEKWACLRLAMIGAIGEQ